MNEPGTGLIGVEDLAAKGVFTLDVAPTLLQGMAAGAGIQTEVKRYRLGPIGPVVAGRETLNPEGLSAWNRTAGCPWRERRRHTRGLTPVSSTRRPTRRGHNR